VQHQRVLLIRLPCNPIFPIGPVYLADHLHKCFPGLEQRLLDLAAVPLIDVDRVLRSTIAAFRPSLLVFSWRDIQIYAPVDGRGGNPLQHSFEVFYATNPLRRLRGALGGLRLMGSFYGELWRNLRLIRRGRRWARRFTPGAEAMVGGGAVSVFYEQLGRRLPAGTIVSVGEGETLLERLIRGESISGERCFRAGEIPRPGLIHEQPGGLVKTACNYDHIAAIWPQLDWYLDAGDFYVGVQTKRGCPHNCCYCVYTVVEGKQVRVNPVAEVVDEMRQLHRRGVRAFWFTDAQFIPARRYIDDAKDLSVNYSFNVIDERPETIRQTVAYHRELERIFGADLVEPAIFFIGLQPHTHLEEYGFAQGMIRPGYDPMSMLPWTARQLLWNPEPMGSVFGRICLEAFATDPADFGRTVMALLERDYGCAPLEEALSAPISGRPALARAYR
jgi:radical SAM superfamily enzyme YgiQ (UPF0313 family)